MKGCFYMDIRRCVIVRRLGREDEPIDYNDIIADEEYEAEEMKEPNWSEFRGKILKSFPDDYENLELFAQQVTTDETGYNWDSDTTQEWSCPMKDIVEGSGSSEEKTRFFIDMDGTLDKWQPVASEEELLEKGFYRNLKPNLDMVQSAQNLISMGFDVYILSCVLPQSQYAEREKREWLKQYIPELPKEKYIFVPYGENKADYLKQNYSPITKNDYLIDDYTKNLLEWKEFGGTGVKYLNGINDTRGTWQGLRISNNQYYDLSSFAAKNGLVLNNYDELVSCIDPNITVLNVPNHTTGILGGTFYSCESLKRVTIPNSVERIGPGAFQYCYNLKCAEVGAEVIDSKAFAGCPNLERVVISDGVEAIAPCAFEDCNSLKSIEIPDSVQKIGGLAFEGCKNLTDVKMSDELAQTIDFESVFRGTPFLDKWRFQQENTIYDGNGRGR